MVGVNVWPWSRPAVPLAGRKWLGDSALWDADVSSLGPAQEWLRAVVLVVGHLLLFRYIDFVSADDTLSTEHIKVDGQLQKWS